MEYESRFKLYNKKDAIRCQEKIISIIKHLDDTGVIVLKRIEEE